MDNQFTEAWYSPKSKQLVLFLCKEPPKTCCIMGSWKRSINAIALDIAQFLCYCKKAYLCRLLDSGRQTYYWFKLTMPSPRVQPWVREKSMGSFPEQQLVIEPNPGLKVNSKINFSCTQMFFTAFVLSCWRFQIQWGSFNVGLACVGLTFLKFRGGLRS